MNEGGCPFRHVLKLVGTPYAGALLIGFFTIAGAVYYFLLGGSSMFPVGRTCQLSHPTRAQADPEELIKRQFQRPRGVIRIHNGNEIPYQEARVRPWGPASCASARTMGEAAKRRSLRGTPKDQEMQPVEPVPTKRAE